LLASDYRRLPCRSGAGFTEGWGLVVAVEPVGVAVAVLNSGLSAKGFWCLIQGWRAKRRDGDQERLMMVGAEILLLSLGIWGSIYLWPGWSRDVNPMAEGLVLGLSLAFLLLAIVVDARRRRLTRKSAV
jgi:hypothetical protein